MHPPPPSNVQQLIAHSQILIILITSLRRLTFALASNLNDKWIGITTGGSGRTIGVHDKYHIKKKTKKRASLLIFSREGKSHRCVAAISVPSCKACSCGRSIGRQMTASLMRSVSKPSSLPTSRVYLSLVARNKIKLECKKQKTEDKKGGSTVLYTEISSSWRVQYSRHTAYDLCKKKTAYERSLFNRSTRRIWYKT